MKTLTPRVRLKSIRISHFRSCSRTIFKPHDDLSCLIGPNGSGKTSVLHGIRLLRNIFTLGLGPPSEQPSGQCRLKAEFSYGRYVIPLRAHVIFATSDLVGDEVVQARIEWNFGSVGEKDAWVSLPLRAMMDRSMYLAGATLGPSSIGETRGRLKWLTGTKFGTRAVRALLSVLDFVNGITYYGASQFTNPSQCPSSFELDEHDRARRAFRMRSQTKFLVDLYAACSDEARESEYKQFRSLVGRNGLGLIEDISFAEYELPE